MTTKYNKTTNKLLGKTKNRILPNLPELTYNKICIPIQLQNR